jgi:hypothetical protein
MRTSSKDFIVKNTDHESKYYTTLQHQEFTDENECYRLSKDGDKVFAKAIKFGMSKNITKFDPVQFRYYVRANSKKQLFDPFPRYSVSDNKSSFIDKVCKGENNFVEVTQSVFDKYVNFLSTENNQWLIRAQREIL